MIYPDLISLTGKDEDQHALAACPCGVAGTLDAIGWMGDRCAACHDRSEEGQELPGWRRIAPWKIGYNAVAAVAFSPDSQMVAAVPGGWQPLAIRDLETAATRTWKPKRQEWGEIDLAFLPDGNLLVAHTDEVLILDPHKFTRRGRFVADPGLGWITRSADGALVLTSAGGGNMSV